MINWVKYYEAASTNVENNNDNSNGWKGQLKLLQTATRIQLNNKLQFNKRKCENFFVDIVTNNTVVSIAFTLLPSTQASTTFFNGVRFADLL